MNGLGALDIAHRIGVRLAKAALWHGDACTWEAVTTDRTAPFGNGKVQRHAANGAMYDGTSGIALFLAEAYRLTGDLTLLRVGEGALRHAANTSEIPTNLFGFYTGRIGIAYAMQRFAQCTGRDEWIGPALSYARRLIGRENEDRHLDVISGAAGAIPPLLQMADSLGAADLAEIASTLGNHVLAQAHRGALGWSWQSMPGAVRNLTGYGHGASGYAHALMELYAATGDARYGYAAEQAIVYERHYFNADAENWPDFRNLLLNEFLAKRAAMSRVEAERALSELKPYQPSFMSAWCHGAPGIGAVRLRHYELFGTPSSLIESMAAIRHVTNLLTQRQPSNFSLCHGILGNCETLLLASSTLGEQRYANSVADFAQEAALEHELSGLPWPSGIGGGVEDPTLMLGDAGVGYFFLRLASNDVQSVLLPVVRTAASLTPWTEDAGAVALHSHYIGAHFGTALAVLHRSVPQAHLLRRVNEVRELHSIRRIIAELINQEPDPRRREMLGDAAALEVARYELAHEAPAACDIFLRSEREKVTPRVTSSLVVMLACALRIVEQRWDWDKWLRTQDSSPDTAPEDREVAWLVYARGDDVRFEPLSALARMVLETVTRARSIDVGSLTGEISGHVIAPRPVAAAPPGRLVSLVAEQVALLMQAGLLAVGPSWARDGSDR